MRFLNLFVSIDNNEHFQYSMCKNVIVSALSLGIKNIILLLLHFVIIISLL